MVKNILILTTVSGFLSKFERGNVRILRGMGYTVHYAANMKEQHYIFDEKELQDMGVMTHHIDIARSPYMFRSNMKAFRQLIKIVRENNICAIHCHTPVGGVFGRLAGRFFVNRGICVLYTVHGFHFYDGAPLINRTIYYLAEKVLAHYTDMLIVINKEDYENGKKLHLRPGGRVYRIPGVGLDMEKFAPVTEKERKECRKKAGVSEKDFFIVSVGELNENKNQEIILKALKKMRDDGEDITHIKYGICGTGFYEERIHNQIEKLGLSNNVTMHGYCMNVPEILGGADVSVFPSVREGLGMAGIEAISMEIPLLASDNRGTREYVKTGVNGYFCEAKNVQSWVDAIKAMRDLPEQELCVMKKNCRKSIESFDKANTDRIMEEVYCNLDRRMREVAEYEETCS